MSSSPHRPRSKADITRELRRIFGDAVLARAALIVRSPDVIDHFSADTGEPDNYVLRGELQGTAPSPYDTRVEIYADLKRGDVEVLDTDCACPVQHLCKHACALILHWTDQWAEAGLSPAPTDVAVTPASLISAPLAAASLAASHLAASHLAASQLTASHLDASSDAASPGAESPAVTSPHVKSFNAPRNETARNAKAEKPAAPITRVLPIRGELHQWLTRSIDTTARADTPARPTPRWQPCIAYVLTDDGELHALRARRRNDGLEMELLGEYVKTAWIASKRERPGYATDSDTAILTLMDPARRALFTVEPAMALSGEGGRQLIELASHTGRLYALTRDAFTQAMRKRGDILPRVLTRPLVMGEARVASLLWRETDERDTRTLRLSASMEGRPVALIPVDPPHVLDVEHNTLHEVSVALSAASLAKLAALPPVPLDDTTAWAYVRDAIEALPDAAAVPPLPLDAGTRLTVPRAILEFALIEHRYQHGWGRSAQEQTLVFPGVHLWFDYAGRRVGVSAAGFDAAIEVEQQGSRTRTTLTRNVRAEMQWLQRMPPILRRAVQVEPALAQTAFDGGTRVHSLWALADHDWSHAGAQVFAEAQAAGFALEIDPAFPLTLEDIATPELELAPAQERGWFRIALGVTVQDKRIDLAPALARLIGAQADPESWLAALPSVPTVLLSVAPPKGRAQAVVVRLPGERLHALLAPVFDWFRGGEMSPISGLQAALQENLPEATIRYLGRDDKRWVALREAIAAGAAPVPVAPHADFRAVLRPYQLHGLAWLSHLHSLSMAAVLADDMGLGKTVQTLAFLHLRRRSEGADRPCLIVAPTSVTVNWLAEAARFAPDLNVLMHRGAARSLDAAALQSIDLVVTSYPILQRDEKTFAELKWDVVVFDEAQTIKNARAKTYQAAQFLDAAMRVALTGTPMENHLGELWALFNLLLPGLLGDHDSFNRVFRHPIEQRAANEQMQKLRARIRPFLLRRTREQVLDDLPEKTEYTRWIELNPAQADLYESLRTAIHDDIRRVIDKKGLKQSTIHILDALLKLRQVCCDPRLVKLPQAQARFADAGSAKLDWLMSHLPELIEEGRQVLVFSQFTSMLALIGEGLTARGIEFVTLTGDTQDRETPIARFQSGEVKLFLLSLKAGGVGLNLTAADTVIHYDPWWNPAVEAQATARAHRIGQTRPVFVTRLVSQGTLEERMLAIIARKRELAQALLEGDGRALTGLTLADVEELLAPISTFVAQTR